MRRCGLGSTRLAIFGRVPRGCRVFSRHRRPAMPRVRLLPRTAAHTSHDARLVPGATFPRALLGAGRRQGARNHGQTPAEPVREETVRVRGASLARERKNEPKRPFARTNCVLPDDRVPFRVCGAAFERLGDKHVTLFPLVAGWPALTRRPLRRHTEQSAPTRGRALFRPSLLVWREGLRFL